MASCACILCVGDCERGCLQVHTVQGVTRLSCNYCRPEAGKPISDEAWTKFHAAKRAKARELAGYAAREEAHDEAYSGNINDPEDNSWRKYDCYNCKDTGECQHCEDDYEED